MSWLWNCGLGPSIVEMITRTCHNESRRGEDSSSLITAGKLLGVVALVLLNAFFVAAEFSLVAVRRSR